MLLGCWYHLLDSALPPCSLDGDRCAASGADANSQNASRSYKDDFLRLEYLSACVIMEDVRTADRLLPHVPPTLYPALFQAVVQRQFNIWKHTKDIMHSTSKLSLVSLLENWPYKELVLKDLIPTLPLPIPRRSATTTSIRDQLGDLNKFYSSFLSIIPFAFLSRYITANERTQPFKLSRLDMSGFYGFFCDNVSLKNLESKVKNAYNPNSPPGYHKDEMVIDAQALTGDHESIGTLGVICTLSGHHGAGLVVKFRRINIMSTVSKSIIAIIDLLAKNNATEYLELEGCEVSDSVVAKLVKLSGTLTGISLSYSIGFTSSLDFLTLLPNLQQLDFSGVILNGKITPLGSLHQGLKYLKLVGCKLKHTDLDVLANSKHTKSLLQLDLSENSFSLPIERVSLFSLLAELSQVQILELENCKLNKYMPEDVRGLVEILRTLPLLRVLALTANDFSSRLLRDVFPYIASNRTLQYLKLTVPSDAYLSDDYNTVAEEIMRLQSDFAQSALSLFGSHLQVGWSEEITYSHWYYSI